MPGAGEREQGPQDRHGPDLVEVQPGQEADIK